MSKEEDAIGLLKADHAAVKKLFEQEEKISKRDGEKKVEVFNQINAALEVHATIEEEIFYPAVKKPGRNMSRTKYGRVTRSTSK
jgi:hemerythrin superfamily protein